MKYSCGSSTLLLRRKYPHLLRPSGRFRPPHDWRKSADFFQLNISLQLVLQGQKKKKSGSAVRHFGSALGRRLQGSSRVTRVGFLQKSHSTRQHILRIRYAKTGKCMLHTTKSTSYSGCQRAPMRRFITDGHGRQHEPDIPSKTNVSDPPPQISCQAPMSQSTSAQKSFRPE